MFLVLLLLLCTVVGGGRVGTGSLLGLESLVGSIGGIPSASESSSGGACPVRIREVNVGLAAVGLSLIMAGSGGGAARVLALGQ